MLVLSRKIDQSIILSDGTTITLVSINGKHAKIGVHAPKHIRVYREEIYKKTLKQTAQRGRA